MGEQIIPVVDLHECVSQPHKLREASEKWGSFRLINHEISSELMAEMKRVATGLFDRPVEVKQRNKAVVAGSGYMPPSENKPFHEALGLFDACSSVAVATFCEQLQADFHQRETMEKYAQAIHKLAIKIVSILAKSMGAATYCFAGWPSQFRINKYSFTPEAIGRLSVDTHTDSGFLTILQDDENLGGLEVMDESGAFVAVNPWPGTLLINLGDMAVPWSNGRLRSVKHRVWCKDAGLRLSIATFLSPPADKVLEVPPEFIDSEHPRLFIPFTYEAYRRLRTQKHLPAGEALELVRAENSVTFLKEQSRS